MRRGRDLFRSYGGTTQSCGAELAAQFEEIAERFETADQTMDEPVSEESYANAIERANGPTATDREVRHLARIEQRYWRERLVSGQQLYSCALCGKPFPEDLVVVAYIKRRSECDTRERLDPENVMRACLLGCDALFEKRYVIIKDGRIRSQATDVFSASVRDAVARLNMKPICDVNWTPRRASYFAAHAGLMED
jgi:hypothetical protein